MKPKRVAVVHSAAAGLETSGDIPELQQAALSAQPFPQNKLLRTEQVQNDASMNKVYAGRRGGRGRVHLKALTGEEQENFEANAVQELLGILGSSLKLQPVICGSGMLAPSGSANQSHSPCDWDHQRQRNLHKLSGTSRRGISQAVQYLECKAEHPICFPHEAHPFPFQPSNISLP